MTKAVVASRRTGVFFEVTKYSLDSITNLCNFVHPVSAALWNMRTEINRLLLSSPEMGNDQLNEHFLNGSNISKADFLAAYRASTWEEHQETVAWICLNSLIAIYEGWLDALHNDVFDKANGNLGVKAMQFPNIRKTYKTNKKGRTYCIIENGIIEELNRLTITRSGFLTRELLPWYTKSRHCCFKEISVTKPYGVVREKRVLDDDMLRNLMYCYRFFKELRNCYFHKALVATDALITAYGDFCNAVKKPEQLNMDEIPVHIIPEKGKRVSVTLRGVIGFSHVIRMILHTVDAQLMFSKYAEVEIARRIENLKLQPEQRKLHISDKLRTKQRIISWLQKANFRFDKPMSGATVSRIVNLLEQNGVIVVCR